MTTPTSGKQDQNPTGLPKGDSVHVAGGKRDSAVAPDQCSPVPDLNAANIEELATGDGCYYVAQERAMAPGISGEWPEVIQHPTNRNGRLVKRTWNKEKA